MPNVERYQKYVATVPLGALIVEVADQMRLQAVGSLVVLADDEHPVGMITDRDLTLRVVAEGRDPEKIRASAVMSQPLIEVTPSDSLEHVIEVMQDHGVRRVPVVREKRVIGLVALDDLLATLVAELDEVVEASRREIRSAQRIARVREARREVEDRIYELVGQAERLGDRALEGVVGELETLIARVRRLFD